MPKLVFDVSIYAQQTAFFLKNVLWLSLGSNQYQAGRVYDLCVYFMTGAPEGASNNLWMYFLLAGETLIYVKSTIKLFEY